jgi:hypothetical protein
LNDGKVGLCDLVKGIIRYQINFHSLLQNKDSVNLNIPSDCILFNVCIGFSFPYLDDLFCFPVASAKGKVLIGLTNSDGSDDFNDIFGGESVVVVDVKYQNLLLQGFNE